MSFSLGDELLCRTDGGNWLLTVGKVYTCQAVHLCFVYIKSDDGVERCYSQDYFTLADCSDDSKGFNTSDLLDRLAIVAESLRDDWKRGKVGPELLASRAANVVALVDMIGDGCKVVG